MEALQVNQDLVNLMASLRPFLSDRGKSLVEAGESFSQLLLSEHANRTMNIFNSLKSSQSTTNNEAQGEGLGAFFGGNWSFAIFLILILLFFSS